MTDKAKTIRDKLDIFNADGSYDEAKVAQIKSKKIDFAYDNAVAFMKEVETRFLSNKDSVEWLLRFSTVAVLTLGALLYEYLTSNPTDIHILEKIALIYIIFSFAVYLSVILSVSKLLISKSFGEYIHNEPENILDSEISKLDEKIIKLDQVINLQDRIDTITAEQEKYAMTIKAYMKRVRINTIVTFSVFCLWFVIEVLYPVL